MKHLYSTKQDITRMLLVTYLVKCGEMSRLDDPVVVTLWVQFSSSISDVQLLAVTTVVANSSPRRAK